MKRLLSHMLLGGALTLGASSQAHLPHEPCSFTFGAEYLYMQNATDQPYFAVDRNPAILAIAPNGTRYANEQGWHSGYRLEGSYQFDCLSDICVRWTHFPNFSDSRSLSSPTFALFPTLGFISTPIGVADINDRYQFYTLEALYEYAYIDNSLISLKFLGGVQYNRLKLDEHIFYDFAGDSFSNIDIESKRDNIGLELGGEFEWAFTDWLSFEMRGSSSLLASYKKSQFTQITPNSPILITTQNDENHWILIPALNFRAGFSYDYAFCSGILNLGIGYEFIAYFNGLDRHFNSTGSTISFNEYRHFMLQGLYAHAGYTF